MLFPHVRDNDVKPASRPKHPRTLCDRLLRFRSVFKHDHGQNRVKYGRREGHSLQPTDHIQLPVVPCRVALCEIQSHIAGMRKCRLEAAFARARIQNALARPDAKCRIPNEILDGGLKRVEPAKQGFRNDPSSEAKDS